MNLPQFQEMFPDEETCLRYLLGKRKCACGGEYKRIKNRRSFYCPHCGKQLSVTAHTIFHKSSTPLVKWFFAIYLMCSSKHGVNAYELQKHLGVTYKCAYRIGMKIRRKMKQEKDQLKGVIEVDETYFGGRNRSRYYFKKSMLLGMVERGGRIKAFKVPNRGARILLSNINAHIKKGSILCTDEYRGYKRTSGMGYEHRYVKHGKKHWTKGDVYTNTIEGFWSILKNGIRGDYRHVSHKRLPLYVNEFVWRYNHREDAFEAFLASLKP